MALVFLSGAIAGCATPQIEPVEEMTLASADSSETTVEKLPAADVAESDAVAAVVDDDESADDGDDRYANFWVPGVRQTVDDEGNIVEYQEAVITPGAAEDPNHGPDPFYYPGAQGWVVGPDGNLYPVATRRHYRAPVLIRSPQQAPTQSPMPAPPPRQPVSRGHRSDTRGIPSRGPQRDRR